MGKALSEEQQAEARMCVSEEVGGRVCTRQDVRGDQHALMSLAERPGEPLKHWVRASAPRLARRPAHLQSN